jgi:hypothetical protein
MTSAILASLEKTSADRLDYDVNYSNWLTDEDIIISANVNINNIEVTFVADTVEISDQTVRVWMAGGLDGETSEVAVYATTNAGRVKEARFALTIKDT